MCYQCSGCGRCLNGGKGIPSEALCPCCKQPVEEGVRFCPNCGMYIRPKVGSVKLTRRDLRQVEARSE